MSFLMIIWGLFISRLQSVRWGMNSQFQGVQCLWSPRLLREKDPIASRRWIDIMKNAQHMSFFLKGLKVGFSFYLLRDGAHDQWEEVGHYLVMAGMVVMTWDDFVVRFRVKFSLDIKVQQLAREFQDLRRTKEIVVEIIAQFQERDLLVLQYVTKKEMRKMRYHDMLRDNIQEFVSMSN